jgi:hypothetical protein
MPRPARLGLAALLSSASIAHGACPANHVEIEAGRGDEVDAAGVGWRHALGDDCGARRFALLLRADHWRGRDPAPASRSIWDVSATPVLELPVSAAPWPLRVDIGIGVHAITHTHINAERRMSTAFQFGEFIGATLDLRGYEIGLRVQHVSNGGIKHPNDGMTYTLLTISRGF